MTDQSAHFKALRDKYRAVFCDGKGGFHPAGNAVLADLRRMTKYGSSPFVPDPISMAYHVGMQDVFRHIQMVMNLSDADIYRLTATPQQQEEGWFGND